MKEFINEYKGIIGTIIGTLLGFGLGLLKDYFKNRGEIYYDFSKFQLEYCGKQIDSVITTYSKNINSLRDINNFIYSFTLKISNESNQTKALKDFKVIFILNENEKLEGVPYVFSHKVVGKFNEFKDLTLLELKPYETQEIEIKVSINKTNITEQLEFNNIYFEAKNIKNKRIKVKIK